MAKVIFKIFDGVSLVRVLIYRHSKSAFLQVTFEF